MKMCRVIGKAQAALKHPTMTGAKLFVVKEVDESGKAKGNPFLAVDGVGAGEGEMVAVTIGSSAGRSMGSEKAPLDAVIVAILDTVVVNGGVVYTREEGKA